MTTSKNTQAQPEQEILTTPVNLIYLVFVFFPLLFWQQPPMSAVIGSIVAALLFVPLSLAFRKAELRRQLWLLVAVALLGYALIPSNPGGNTFIIYAMGMAATSLPARTAVAVSSLLVAVMAAEFYWVMPTLMLAVASVTVVVVVGTMLVASILNGRARAWRNAELRLSQAEVRRLATIAERERIGRDLHDLLGHTLSVVALKSELAGKLLDHDPGGAREQIREVEVVARNALAQVREAVAGIRAAGIEAEVAAARMALLSADVSLDQRLASVTLDSKTELTLAMATREAVTNIIRHASARRVEVELSTDATGTRMVIADDGCGGIERHGNGLTGMRERLQALGGTLDVDSPAGGGTRLVMWVPAETSS